MTITACGSTGFTYLYGFGMFIDNNTRYYAIDKSGFVCIFNENWNYIGTSQSFSNPTYMIAINNKLYIAGNFDIYIADKYLTISSHYLSQDIPMYFGIYYNCNNSFLYLAS